jgi:hypothetical protein
MRWGRNVAQIEDINAMNFLDGKSEGRPLESLNLGSYNIKMNINDIDCESGDFICNEHLDAYNVGNFLSR